MDSNSFYQRQILLPEVGKLGQEKLLNSKVLVVGVGGLGCPALQYLTAAGVGTIGIIDFDKVSINNLHRQILFSPQDCGLNKALVAQQKLQKQNPHISILAFPLRFDSNWAQNNLREFDIIIDGSDNFETKFLIHDLCFKNKKCLVQASIYQFEGQIHVFNFLKNNEAPCLRCLWEEIPAPYCVNNCEQAGVMGFVSGFFGVMQAAETIKMILGLTTIAQGESMIFNFVDNSLRKIKWSKNSHCKLCSANANTVVNSELQYINSWVPELENYFWIDVRDEIKMDDHNFLISKSIHKIFHIPGQKLIDGEGSHLKNEKIVLFCDRGVRSSFVAKELIKQGFTQVYSFSSGSAGFEYLT